MTTTEMSGMDRLTAIERLRLHIDEDFSAPDLSDLLEEIEALEEAHRRALQAAPAPSDALRVKPLEWKPYGDKGGVVASCQITCREYAAWPSVQHANQFALRGPWRDFTYHPSVEDAKAAAQDHYDASILSCLAPAQSEALRDVVAERERQITAEGWTPQNDDAYQTGDLANAAARYAMPAPMMDRDRTAPAIWPWAASWWKPTNRRRNLVKAGALILAEIERLDRAPKAEALTDRQLRDQITGEDR